MKFNTCGVRICRKAENFRGIMVNWLSIQNCNGYIFDFCICSTTSAIKDLDLCPTQFLTAPTR